MPLKPGEFEHEGRIVTAFRSSIPITDGKREAAVGDWIVTDRGNTTFMEHERFLSIYGKSASKAGIPFLGKSVGFGTDDDPRNVKLE